MSCRSMLPSQSESMPSAATSTALGDTDASASLPSALADPVGWALRTLGFDLEAGTPERSAIQRSFRQSLIEAHPDHGGADDEAAQRIADITEARRILLAS